MSVVCKKSSARAARVNERVGGLFVHHSDRWPVSADLPAVQTLGHGIPDIPVRRLWSGEGAINERRNLGDRDRRGCGGNDSLVGGSSMTPDYMSMTCATCRHCHTSATQSRPGVERLWECRFAPPTMFLWRSASGEMERVTEFPVVGTGVDGDWIAACSKHEPTSDEHKPLGIPPF